MTLLYIYVCVVYDQGKGIYRMRTSKGCAKYSRHIKGVPETIFGNMVFVWVQCDSQHDSDPNLQDVIHLIPCFTGSLIKASNLSMKMVVTFQIHALQ
jgi:hypothetical protein